MKRSLIILSAVLLVVKACSSDKDKKEAPRLCPQTAIVRELERIKDYGGETPDEKALVAVALMQSVRGRCDYKDDGVDENFDLNIVAERAERLGGDQVSFPFFIAVLDPDHKIISKELMTTDITFHGKDKKTEQTESLHVFIPVDKDANGEFHQVLMGFQLTEDQLNAQRKAAEEPGR